MLGLIYLVMYFELTRKKQCYGSCLYVYLFNNYTKVQCQYLMPALWVYLKHRNFVVAIMSLWANYSISHKLNGWPKKLSSNDFDKSFIYFGNFYCKIISFHCPKPDYLVLCKFNIFTFWTFRRTNKIMFGTFLLFSDICQTISTWRLCAQY